MMLSACRIDIDGLYIYIYMFMEFMYEHNHDDELKDKTQHCLQIYVCVMLICTRVNDD